MKVPAGEYPDEVAYASHVFSRIRRRRQQLQIVLSRPREHIYHSLGHRNQTAVTEGEVDAWIECGDHDLLKKILASGKIPEGLIDGASYPPTHYRALRIAANRGYRVPPKYYQSEVSNPNEDEAWYALQEMMRGSPNLWKRHAIGSHRKIFENVAQVRAQFIVPSLGGKTKPPYILDQLWIVRAGDNRVRLLCFEIDGEIHEFESWQKAEDRDEDLAALGYEVFHINGSWCRVDSYRAICEFLVESEIEKNAVNMIVGSELKRMDEYVCAECEKPMVRWEDNWIRETLDWKKRVLVHRHCLEG